VGTVGVLAILATEEVIVVTEASEAHGTGKPKEARITVNGQFVVVPKDKLTGLEIKEAAIQAGVPIQVDFVLSEVHPSGEQKIIPDDREVPVKDGDEFWAIPGDDNS
jgi:hypothetical protein